MTVLSHCPDAAPPLQQGRYGWMSGPRHPSRQAGRGVCMILNDRLELTAMILPMLAAALLLAGQDSAADAPAPKCDASLQVCPVIDPATGLPKVWPVDIQGFQDDVETCVHFAGEEAYDADRRRQIEAAIRRHCDAL
eukprot:gene16871-16686_t